MTDERDPGSDLEETLTVSAPPPPSSGSAPTPSTPQVPRRSVLDPPTAPGLARVGFTGDRAAASEAVPSRPVSERRAPVPPVQLPPSEQRKPFDRLPSIPGYLIEQPLGHGGMAEVYKAQRLGGVGVPVPCVVKTIIAGKEDDPRFREKFLAEARIHATMQHPNLVQVLDVGEAEDGRLYLVMEWVEGLDVSGLIRSARKRTQAIPLRHVLFILRQALQGLHHTHTSHGSGFVHRDISPGNVLISRQGAVKLADFGVARSIESLARTRQRTLAGKLHYFAPELITGRSGATVQSDVFAVGVTLWEMLTCRPLFPRRARWARLQSEIAAFDPRRLLEDELTIPEGLEDIVLRSLARHPGDRYGTALEFLEDVNDYAYESGLRLLDVHFATYVERVLAAKEGSA